MDQIVNKNLVLLLVCAGILSSCAYFNTFYNAETAYSEGYKAYLQNRREGGRNFGQSEQFFRDAATKCRKVLNEYSSSRYVDDAYLLLGKSNYYLRLYKDAIDALQTLLLEFPDSPFVTEAHLYLGKSFLETQQYRSARDEFEALLQEDIQAEIRAQAHMALAELHRA